NNSNCQIISNLSFRTTRQGKSGVNIFPVPSRICRVRSSCQSSVLSCQSSVLGPQSSVLSRQSLERGGGVIGEARTFPSGAGIAKTPIYSALLQSVTKSARPAPRHFKTN